jgi:hypothetical protein
MLQRSYDIYDTLLLEGESEPVAQIARATAKLFEAQGLLDRAYEFYYKSMYIEKAQHGEEGNANIASLYASLGEVSA